jgi:hypothetical protein
MMEPAEQSRSSMLMSSEPKTYLMERIRRRCVLGHCGHKSGHKSEPRNMGRGARQHTLLDLNRFQSSGGTEARGQTA